MPGSIVAPFTAWQRGNRNLPGPQRGASTPGVPFLDQFVPGYNLALLIYPGVDATTDPATWTGIDVTRDLLQPDDGGTPAITVTRARADERSQAPPAGCQFTIKNSSGNYTPGRVSSIYWPYMDVGLPCKVTVATASGTFEQFSGQVDDLSPDWDTTGNYATVVVTAHGKWQVLAKDDIPLLSAMTRAVGAASPAPVAWWPLEDGSTVTTAASGLAGGAPMTVKGAVVFSGVTGAPGTGPLVDMSAAGQLIGTLPIPTSATNYRLEMAVLFPTSFDPPSDGFCAVVDWFTPGAGTDFWELDATDLVSGGLYVQWSDNGGASTALYASNVDVTDGLWHHVRIDMAKVGGNQTIGVYLDGTLVINQDSGAAWGVATKAVVNPAGDTGAAVAGFGQLICWAPAGSVVTLGAFAGHDGEDPVTRAARLCDENSIPFVADGTSRALMGPQGVDTLPNLLHECEAADGGLLEDGVGFGFRMNTTAARVNAAVALTAVVQQLDGRLAPVTNNMAIVNRATVSRPAGLSATYTQPAGLPYAPTGAGGIGVSPFPAVLNLQDDTTLPQRAARYVRLGTAGTARYPTLPFNLAARPELLPAWLACGVSSRLVVTGGYPTGPDGNIDVLVEGWTLGLSRMVCKLVANCSPTLPWQVAVYGTARYDSLDSTLAAGVDTTAVTLSVATTTGTLWSTTAAPFDIQVGGERMTVTAVAGAGSPQSFTVTRGVNGIVRSQAANAPVRLWDTPYYGF